MSFDLSSVGELQPLAEIIRSLSESGRGVVTRFLIIGATARDLILRYVHNLPVTRLTVDLDVAVTVVSWADFATLRERLIAKGATAIAAMPHRVLIHDWQIDIVPFGGVEVNGVIAWPPDREVEMTVLGFAEAARHELEVILPNDTVVSVASLPALLLMKVIAWSERHQTLDDRDARDIHTLIDGYAGDWNQDRLYGNAGDLLESFGFDNELAAAALLGRDAAKIAEPPTARRVEQVLERETLGDSMRLASDMGGRADVNLQLLRALRVGFAQGQRP
jgi:predicted nucleotidyltransferase